MPSRRKKLVNRLVTFVVIRLQRWLERQPAARVERVGARFGRWFFRLAGRRRIVAIENLAYAFPEASEAKRADLARRAFEHFGRTSAEFIAGVNRTLPELQQTTTVKGWDYFEAARAEGNGLLLITGHFGHFERVAAFLSLSGYPVNVVIRDASDPEINDLVNRLRGASGTRVIPRGDAARPILEALNRKEIVGILPDQNDDTIFIPFFGKPAGTVLGPGVIADRTKAPVLPVVCRALGGGQYEIEFYPLLTAQPGFETRGEGMMRAIHAWLEGVIRETPEQWLWFHDRWRSAKRKGLL